MRNIETGSRRLWHAARGHFWTIAPALRHHVIPLQAPESHEWRTTWNDDGREVHLAGLLRERSESDTVVVVVHGLGGNVGSHYCVRAARAIDARGWSCLRFHLRGADRDGTDLFHAGLTSDLSAALGSSTLQRYRRVLVVGYSLGGHVALRLACGPCDPRVVAVAAVCAPLDLTRSAAAFDQPRFSLYRLNIFAGLRASYARIAARVPVPTPPKELRRVDSIRAWDTLTVVPRFGFADADDYYRRASVGPLLGQIRRPALIVHSTHDPVVPISSVAPALEGRAPSCEVWRLAEGGHVGFPPRIGLHGCGPRSLEAHVLQWLDSQ